jgi:hypothetical protein
MNLALDFGKEPMSSTLQEIHEDLLHPNGMAGEPHNSMGSK